MRSHSPLCVSPLRFGTAPAALVLMMGVQTPRNLAAAQFVYLSPQPGSAGVSPLNNVAWRSDDAIDPASLRTVQITARGSVSGTHSGTLSLSDDGRTLLFTPRIPWSCGERVEILLAGGLQTMRGGLLPAGDFAFDVAASAPRAPQPPLEEAPLDRALPAVAAPRRPVTPNAWCETPPTCPIMYASTTHAPESGAILVAPPTINATNGNLLMVDDDAQPLFYRRLSTRAQDFTMQPNGRLSYFDGGTSRFYLLDSTYAVVDSIAAGNGYTADLHDLQILPDGHALLMALDPEPVRMDSVVSGGNPDAIVTGLIIQELDLARNVVFQWRSWDHYQITDALPCFVDLTAAKIDYVHGNALAPDLDGNLLLSARHLSEITKIDRNTGAMLWRLGLNAKNNQFTFVGDNRGFSGQHDIRRLPNGHITLFDNGNCMNPLYSRAVEYALDEDHKIATEVWEYRETPDLVAAATGNVQRRASGGTMINWGLTGKITDLAPDGASAALRLGFADSRQNTYRAFRFPWRQRRFAADRDSLAFGIVAIGDTAAAPLTITNLTAAPETLRCFTIANETFSVSPAPPIAIAPHGHATLTVRYAPSHSRTDAITLYAISADSVELVAAPVTLTGTGIGIAAAGEDLDPRIELPSVSPSPSRGPVTISFTLGRPAHVRLELLDVQGRRLATLAHHEFSQGHHEVPWNPGGARRAGVFFVRYEIAGRTGVRPLILVP